MMKNGKAWSEKQMQAAQSPPPSSAKIQTYACVIGIGPDWEIITASENVEGMLGCPATEMLGRPLSEVLHEDTVHRLRSLSQVLSLESPVSHFQGCELVGHDKFCDLTVTLSGRNVFFEFEEAESVPDLATGLEQIQRLVHRIARKSVLEEAAFEAARTVQALSEFDRVSIHRVEKTGLSAPLGLADRAPLQSAPDAASLMAHAENFCAHLHLVPDSTSADSALLLAAPKTDRTVIPDARGLCSFGLGDELRAALIEKGVRAAMTIPIRVGGALWGLFICHHSEPKTQSVGRRSALSLFSLLFGYEVERLHERVGLATRERARVLRHKLVSRLNRVSDFPDAVMDACDDIHGIVSFDGLAIWYRGVLRSQGKALRQSEFEPVFSHLQWPEPGQLTALNRLDEIGVTSEKLDPATTSLLAVPVSVVARDYVLLFRDNTRHRDSQKPWLPWEIEAAASLSSTMIESHSKLVEDLLDIDTDNRDQKGLLISELNHRVRNTLNLIRGMISQGREGAETVDAYAQELEGRVYALARAHDQLTEVEWSWMSLQSLVALQIEDITTKATPPIKMTGLEIDLSPTAYTTLALVLHELTSNARAHGALSTDQGRVALDVLVRKDGFAEIVWTEHDGPPAKKPEKFGFGLTIVEQSVPFELRGFSDIQFEPTGLKARFLVPPGHIRRRETDTQTTIPRGFVDQGFDSDMSIDGAAMILEDSLIIAIEAADLLREAGATKVYSCNSVESAFRVLDESDISFALLDVNLGEESSLAVAEQLWSDGIPAVLATGYGSDKDLMTQFPPMPILTKPYGVKDLKDVLRSLNKAAAKA